MRLAPVIAACVAVLLAAPRAGTDDKKPEPANLLVNGSFEDGPDPGDFLPLDKGAKDIKGWVVVNAQIDYIGTHWTAADGKRSLDLNGSPGVGGVAQTFKTTKGKKYRVTFSLAGNPNGTNPKKTLAVRAAGKEKGFTFDTTGKTQQEMGWRKETWEFTAVADETTLEIVSTMDDDTSSGPALDNVSVVLVND